MFATADDFALCDMRTVAKLQFHLKYNGRNSSDFEKVFPLVNCIIRHYHVCAWSLFSTFRCGTAECIHSVTCSHVRIISFTNSKWNGNGNGFGLFSALFIIIRTNSRIQSITIMFTDFCTASIRFKTFWYHVKWSTFTIAACSAQESASRHYGESLLLLRTSQTINQCGLWMKEHVNKKFQTVCDTLYGLCPPKSWNRKVHWHAEKLWAKKPWLWSLFESMKEKAIGKTSEYKKIYINVKLTNFKDSFESIGVGTLSISCPCVCAQWIDRMSIGNKVRTQHGKMLDEGFSICGYEQTTRQNSLSI